MSIRQNLLSLGCVGVFALTFLTQQSSAAPTVQSIVRRNSNPTNADVVEFLVTFRHSVNGVAADEFQIVQNKIFNASIVDVSGSGNAYIVKVDTGTGNGTVGIKFDGRVTSQASDYNVTFDAGQSYDVDKSGPNVTVDILDLRLHDHDRSSLVTFQFTEPVIGFTPADLAVSGGAVSNFLRVTPSRYQISFTANDNLRRNGSVLP